MSSLLERAIIDATALKEAALKTAENTIIEKYSNEVKAAMDRLLEQEGDPFAMTDASLSDPAPMGLDSMELDTNTDAGIDSGLEPGQEEDESLEGDEEQDEEEFFNQIPMGFDPDLADPEDEIINIKLDSLRAELPDEEEDIGVFGGDDKLDDDEVGVDILGDEEEIDFDSEFGDDEEDLGLDADDEEIDADELEGMISEIISNIDLDEISDEEELEEAVRVDFEPQKSGWAGTPESIMREYESMLLAREQDTEVKEENEELRKTVAALQKENKTLGTVATKLQAQNEKFTATLETLQEKLETTNVSNAKLLYINRALENASLNERQKEKIVEAISKAETIQEAKIVFDTLEDTITSSPAEKKSGGLNEAVSRRSTLLVNARSEQRQKVANPVYDRLQKLAGIKT